MFCWFIYIFTWLIFDMTLWFCFNFTWLKNNLTFWYLNVLNWLNFSLYPRSCISLVQYRSLRQIFLYFRYYGILFNLIRFHHIIRKSYWLLRLSPSLNHILESILLNLVDWVPSHDPILFFLVSFLKIIKFFSKIRILLCPQLLKIKVYLACFINLILIINNH